MPGLIDDHDYIYNEANLLNSEVKPCHFNLIKTLNKF